MSYKLAIFDLDGTALNTLTDLTISVNHALTQNGFQVRTKDDVRSFIGNGIRILLKRCLPADVNEDQYEKVVYDYLMYYDTHYNDHTQPYDGIIDLIKKLRANGITTALVSNKGNKAVQALAKEHYDGCFDFVLGVSPERPIKPNPDMCLYALSQLGFDKCDAVYIGDTEVDKQFADNAGVDIIGVDWGFRGKVKLKELGFEKIVCTTEELFEMITK